MEDIQKTEKVERSIFKQFFLAFITNFCALAPSMSLGFSAIAMPEMKNPENPYKLTETQISWFASIANVATPLGCFLSGPISDRFGRKVALLIINVVGLMGWLPIAAAYYHPEIQYPLLLAGRVVTGLSTGLASMPAAVYMAEVASPQLRGMFTTWTGLFFSIGVLVVYCIGLGLKTQWGMVALIISSFPLFGLIFTIFFVPESPTWLISKNRIEDAKRNLTKIYATKDYNQTIQEEISTLLHHKQRNTTTTTTVSYKSPQIYKPFLLMVTYFFFQQFSGTFVIIFYAIDIVKLAEVEIDNYIAIVLIALTRVIAAILVSYLSKHFGRRPHSVVSGAGMAICMILLAVYVSTSYHNSTIPILLLVAFFFTSTLGFLTMPFAMTAELFPSTVRGLATGLVCGLGYFFNFIVVKVYPSMKAALGAAGVFSFYGGIALVGTVFVVVWLPETKGKTLQEIEERFGKGKGRDEEMVAVGEKSAMAV